jgi:hypothetical protein
MDSKSDDERFSQEESHKRFEAALRGARLAGHVPMKAKPKVKKVVKKMKTKKQKPV